MHKVPPLYGAVLISSTAAMWTLAGYERITSGAPQHEYSLGQSWIIVRALLRTCARPKTSGLDLPPLSLRSSSYKLDGL
jgi:hypothetical protein